jgi:hypothetical protein
MKNLRKWWSPPHLVPWERFRFKYTKTPEENMGQKCCSGTQMTVPSPSSMAVSPGGGRPTAGGGAPQDQVIGKPVVLPKKQQDDDDDDLEDEDDDTLAALGVISTATAQAEKKAGKKN